MINIIWKHFPGIFLDFQNEFYHFPKAFGKIRLWSKTNLGIKPDGFWFWLKTNGRLVIAKGLPKIVLLSPQVFIIPKHVCLKKKIFLIFAMNMMKNWVINWSNVAQKYDGIFGLSIYYFNFGIENMTWRLCVGCRVWGASK